MFSKKYDTKTASSRAWLMEYSDLRVASSDASRKPKALRLLS